MKTKYVYFSNNSLGKIENEKVIRFTEEEEKAFLKSIEKRIIQKDSRRKAFSLGSMIFSAIVAIVIGVLALLKILDIQLIVYTFIIAGCFLLWTLLYYLLGFIFYSRETFIYEFKNVKSANPTTLVRYASSDYAKYIEKYEESLIAPNLIDVKKNKSIIFAEFNPKKIKNRLIFNGKIFSLTPYFYLSFKEKRILLLPGIVIYVDGKKSMARKSSDLKCIKNILTYSLYLDDVELIEFSIKGDFNINVFNFEY